MFPIVGGGLLILLTLFVRIRSVALFLDPPNAVLSPNMLALHWITAFGGSFTTTPQTLQGTPVLRVTYQKSTTGFGEDRIEQIANVLTAPIVLSAKNSSFKLPNGAPITDVAATVLFEDSVQIVAWDQTECSGQGYHVFGVNGKAIPQPAWVYVAHELSHAFHNALGTSPPAGVEIQAILDENAHRAQHGLPLRDPGSHKGGCGPGPVQWWLPSFPFDLLKELIKSNP